MYEYFKLHETEQDRLEFKHFQQAKLLLSLTKIIDSLSGRLDRITGILENPACGQFLKRHPKMDLYLQRSFTRVTAHLDRRDKDRNRLSNCQKEWIGFAAGCCGAAIAVPIGCNHRICFLCNLHRAEKFRARVRVMFDRLKHPVFLTLTIPNVQRLRKKVYSSLRYDIRRLLKLHKGWIHGGLYSLETTHNRKTRSWHVHAHVLIDSGIALPRSRSAFIRLKKKLEFDWLLETGGRRSRINVDGWNRNDFHYWFRETEARRGNSDSYQWNRANRRIVDVRRVKDRKAAAYEVLKYVTKASDFVDDPAALDEFIAATKGTRMLQCFGSWYGFQFPKNVNDWSHLECDCGKNEFQRIGLLDRMGVCMGPDGRYHPQPKLLSRGAI